MIKLKWTQKDIKVETLTLAEQINENLHLLALSRISDRKWPHLTGPDLNISLFEVSGTF